MTVQPGSVIRKYASDSSSDSIDSSEKEALSLWDKLRGKKEWQPPNTFDPNYFKTQREEQKDPPAVVEQRLKAKMEKSLKNQNPYDYIFFAMMSNQGIKQAFNDLEKYSPKAYAIFDKYLTKWNTYGDKLSPSGGLTSRSAAEEKEAFFGKDTSNLNLYLLKTMDAVSSKVGQSDLFNEELTRSYRYFLSTLDKYRDDITAPEVSPESVDSDKSITSFLDIFNNTISNSELRLDKIPTAI